MTCRQHQQVAARAPLVLTQVRSRQPRRPALRLAIVTLAVAGSAAAGARLFEDRLDGRDLAVITEPGPLRALPALGAEGGAVPLVGEVARVVQRQGVWTRVALDGGPPLDGGG